MRFALVAAMCLAVLGCRSDDSKRPNDARAKPHRYAWRAIPADDALNASNFRRVKSHILEHGDRQFYGNLGKPLPHARLGGVDFFLFPDGGAPRRYDNLEPSTLNEMSIGKPGDEVRPQHLRVSPGPDTIELLMPEGKEPPLLRARFRDALSEIDRAEAAKPPTD